MHTTDNAEDTILLEPVVSLSEWLEEATKLREELTAKYGKLDLSISDLIHEGREERMNAILGYNDDAD